MSRPAPSLSALLLPALLVGCAPNDATIKNGAWLSWFASNSSSVVENEDVSGIQDTATVYSCSEFVDCASALYIGLDGVTVSAGYSFNDDAVRELARTASITDITTFDEFRAYVEAGVYERPNQGSPSAGPRISRTAIDNCVSGGWDPINERFLNSYHGAQEAGAHGDSRFIGGSCAYESDENGSPVVDDDGRIVYYDASCTDDTVNEIINECAPMVETRMRHGLHDWMTLDGFHALRGTIEPWRTEAIINGEGDLQLTTHFRVDGEDVYFSWTIDPDFSPEQCLSTESGSAESVGVDGGEWIENWSASEDGYDIYYLNAGALQVNGTQTWYLPIDWLAGFGHANFIGEEFYSEPPKYGNYYNETFNFAENEQSFYSVPDRTCSTARMPLTRRSSSPCRKAGPTPSAPTPTCGRWRWSERPTPSRAAPTTPPGPSSTRSRTTSGARPMCGPRASTAGWSSTRAGSASRAAASLRPVARPRATSRSSTRVRRASPASS